MCGAMARFLAVPPAADALGMTVRGARIALPVPRSALPAIPRSALPVIPRRSATRNLSQPAALLLEVVVALAVLVAAMGLLGAQLAGGLNMTAYSEEQLRASLLADRIVALVQLDPDMQRQLAEQDDFEDRFGDEYPGYFWHILTAPLDRDKPDDMKLVTVEVLYQPDKELQDSTSGINSALVLRHLAFFKGKPGTINLVEQAGLSDEAAEELRQAIPIPGFDPSAIDVQQLMAMLTPDQINQLLPMLMPLLQQIAGGNLSDLAGLAEQISGALGPDAMGGMSAEDLTNMIQQAVGGAAPGAVPGRGGTPGPASPGSPGTGGRTPPASPPAGGSGQRGTTPPKPPTTPPAGGGAGSGNGINIGQGSGPNGEYTLEDLMRLRDAYEQQQGGKK